MMESQELDDLERRIARLRNKAYGLVAATFELTNDVNDIREGR